MSYKSSDAGAMAGWMVIAVVVAATLVPLRWFHRRYQVLRRGYAQ